MLNAGMQPNMSNILSAIKSRGLKLNNPISRDTNSPCYLVVADGSIKDYTEHPETVIIEENDNVTDTTEHVCERADGGIVLVRP
jgi:hypothetical protein